MDDERLTSPSVMVKGIITLSTLMAHPLRMLPATIFFILRASRPSRRVIVHSKPSCSKVSPTRISSSSSESMLSNEEDLPSESVIPILTSLRGLKITVWTLSHSEHLTRRSTPPPAPFSLNVVCSVSNEQDGQNRSTCPSGLEVIVSNARAHHSSIQWKIAMFDI